MHIILREDPREWRKFTLQVCGILALLTGWLAWRKVIGVTVWPALLSLFLAAGLTVWARPRWFRGFYRLGMTASAWLGEWVGRVILTVFFLLFMVPLGWVLRLAGHDPLGLRPRSGMESYWRPADKIGKLDRMY